MRTLPLFLIGILFGAIAMFYYMAIQNTANLAYQNGALSVMRENCPSYLAKFEAPAQKK